MVAMGSGCSGAVAMRYRTWCLSLCRHRNHAAMEDLIMPQAEYFFDSAYRMASRPSLASTTRLLDLS
jgi:hypothetical protein